MAVKIKLKRLGTKHKPYFRVVIASERSSGSTGTVVEVIGTYNPKSNPKLIDIDKAKAESWLKKGAIPTDAVKRLLKGLLTKTA